jgi:protein-disulfide isomerase
MHKGTAFVLAALAVVGGYALGRVTKKEAPEPTPVVAQRGGETGGGAAGEAVERKRVPLQGTAKGAPNAIVNIVEFSDFQCPFCSKVVPTLHRLVKEHPNDVRVFFKHYPLPFHADAPLASQAAMAAGAQGKFWEMHDKLFENQGALKRPDLEKYAQELGLDLAKFKAALDGNAHKAQIDADMALASQLGVQGTPNFFINGRSLAGAYPYEAFKKIVEDEISRAKKLMASGTPRAKVYDALMASAGSPAAPSPSPSPAAEPPKAPGAVDVFKVAVGSSATKGAKQPKVTIVEFSEFQCPFCSRVTPTIKQIFDTYKDDVQVAFKHLPLAFHDKAQLAAEAAEAAKAQGKFWEMHDKMFANQGALDRASLEKYAQEIGLNMPKFKAFLDAGKGKAQIDADKQEAAKFGASGTPTFFVNGRMLVGAQPFPAFQALIDEEIKKADEKLKAGVPRKDLYAELTKDGKTAAGAPEAPSAPGEPAAGAVVNVDVAGAPMKGATKDALVTIVEYSDYQCPFCKRVEPTMDRILDEYKGKVRIAWRDFPLDFHQHALPAAIAARVAGEQGKFWQMHKKLFDNQQALDRASLEKYAQELGLNMAKFKKALDDRKYEAEIKADMAGGQKIGVQGTPAFFINGVFLSGAQPFEAFKTRIDAELKKAEELVKKGTPKAKVYEAIMKTAQAAPAAPAAPSEPAGPEADQTAVKVDVGDAPAKGPKNAPITMVVFSDFQCPFCKRVEPTLDEIEKQYPGKIRKVWKDYPLDFHQNAKPAALAARAAGQQGKFWEMHAKLFENQQALDGASLERYAQELRLDVAKFKKSMQDPALAAAVDADFKQGQAIGVTGTPATFINGRKVSGAHPLDTFKKIVDQELAKGKGEVAKGRGGKRS